MSIDISQLPAGAQISGGDAKKAIGVVDERIGGDGDMLAYQAAQIARAHQGNVYQEGGELDSAVLERIKAGTMRGVIGVSQQTVEAMQQGTANRDQAFVGNNANWTGYYLEQGAKYVWPLDTPLRNKLPRVAGVGIDTMNWRAITDVFGGNGPSVGNFILQQQGTPQSLTYNWVNKSNVFKMIAVQDVVTYESELYGRMFEPDVRAKVAAKLIPALMLGQETWYINAAQSLWAPPVPLVTNSTTGGTVAAGTSWFLVTAVNANGETLAYSTLAPNTTTTGTTSSVTLTIFRVPGATKYNVYCGINTGTQPANSAMWLQSATTQFGSASALNDPGGVAYGYFTATMTAAPLTSGTAYSTLSSNTAVAYKSTDANTLNLPLTFDGIQSLIYLNAGTGSTLGVGGETALVRKPASVAGTLVQNDIDTWLEAMYLNSRANPECLLVSVKDHRTISNIVTTGTNFRVTSENAKMGDLTAGGRAVKYINQTTGRLMDIIMLPYLQQGTMIACSMTIPFPVAEIDKPAFRIEYNRELWAVEYPPDQSHKTQWAYSAFGNETMVHQYLGGMGIMNGIVTV